jgi:hypothetical protein
VRKIAALSNTAKHQLSFRSKTDANDALHSGLFIRNSLLANYDQQTSSARSSDACPARCWDFRHWPGSLIGRGIQKQHLGAHLIDRDYPACVAYVGHRSLLPSVISLMSCFPQSPESRSTLRASLRPSLCHRRITMQFAAVHESAAGEPAMTAASAGVVTRTSVMAAARARIVVSP